ncbi:MAG TPA: hypothetical protein VHF47_05465 [Acidimicrobiales bacterium]|nr:hypothetical protein [Acidimicrobiales bacterium]
MLDERARNRMHNRLREVMGDDVAETMMASLPPNGWRELATKQDLDTRLELLEQRLTATFERALRAQTRVYIAWTSGLTAMLVAVFGAVTAIAVR